MNTLISGFRNAQYSKRASFEMKKSSLNVKMLDILVKNGYLAGYIVRMDCVEAYIKYPIQKFIIKQESKSGKRKYIKYKSLLNKNNFYILSTSRYGLITNKEAHSLNVGGELMIEII